MANYMIGQYPFISMSHFPVGQKSATAIEVRPGVDGVYVWNLGQRGQPFTVQTVVDVNDIFSAGVLMSLYEKEIGKVVSVMFAGSAMPKRYAVLDVVPEAGGIQTVLLGVGGVSQGISNGLVVANWTLVAVNSDFQS